MKRIIKSGIVLTLVLLITSIAHAQYPSGPVNGGPGTLAGGGIPQDTQDVPFDGGLSLILIAAGAGVGAKKKKQIQKA